MAKNIITILLDELEVPYTDDFTIKSLQVEPFGNSFYGVAALLARYGIDTRSVRVNDKMSVEAGDLPLIVVFGKEFALLRSVDGGKVRLTTAQGVDHTFAKEEYCSRHWDGNALLVSRRDGSREPDYDSHRKVAVGDAVRSALMFAAFVAIVVAAAVAGRGYWSSTGGVILAINVVGCYVAWLLLSKDLHVPSRMADRLCGLIKESDCGNVTSSEAANFFNIAKLSEIGAGFFLVNAGWIILAPGQLFWPGVAALCVLPFTFWSLWYQKFKSKSWCMLCLLTLILMWAQAIVYVSGGVLHGFSPAWIQGVTLGSAYILAVGLIHWLMSLLTARKEAVAWEARYNALRTEDKVVEAYTKDIPVVDTDSESCSCLMFGRPDASRSITVFSNPYCGPCAELHSLIDNIPSEKVNVRYVMTFFSDDLSKINRFIIAAYRQLGAEKTWLLMSEWFAGGKSLGEAFFAPYGLDPDSPEVIAEFSKQQRWRDQHKFPGTPTVLFNGKEIRKPYSVIDYMYLPL